MKFNFYLLFSIFLMLGSLNSFAQIGIGTKTPASSAALEVTSSTNNKGILIPRITATQKEAIASPAEGLLVYQTTAPIGFYYYTAGTWKLMAIQSDLAGKVDKVDGKNLSTNDYTTAEKTKLSAITGTNTGDQTTITGNAGTATKLATARNINGVAFDGSSDITIAAAADAGTLSGTALKSTVTGSSLTSVGTLANLTVTNPIAGSVTGNAGTATKLAATKNINGVAFDGSADITITAAADAEQLAGTTLKSTVTGSSLTSVGTITNGTWSGTAIAVAKGGTGATTKSAGFDALSPMTTSGDIIYGGTSGTGTRLGKGSDGQVLTLASGIPSWASLSGVPYTGATGAVNLGGYDLTVNELTVGRGGGGKNSNVAIGINALRVNHPDAAENTAIGYAALISQNSSSARANTATGFQSLEYNLSGQENSAFGHNALKTNNASYNTAIGSNALSSNTTGLNNTAIGYAADVSANNLSNATAIGNGAIVAASNTIQLGNTAVTDVKTSGTITAAGLAVTGNVTSTTGSISGFDAALNNQTGTTYTLTSSDNGKVVTLNNAAAITLTINIGLGDGFNCLIVQKGVGQITIAGTATRINRQNHTKTAGQYAVVSIVNIGSDTIIVAGDTGS